MPDEAEEHLPGNVGGAVRLGDTVRRPVGPWTPAVHALLAHLDGRLPHVPRVHGLDERGREVLDYLPGTVVDHESDALTDGQLVALAAWTRALHEAVAGFEHPGPWRYFPIPGATLIGHNDVAPYNACFEGDALAGVFDWDLAGPTTPLAELAFLAWNGVPLVRPLPHHEAARRLELIAAAYGGPPAKDVLRAVPARIEVMLAGIPAAAAAGDAGMQNLMAVGEPARSRDTLAELRGRLPRIDAALGRGGGSIAEGP